MKCATCEKEYVDRTGEKCNNCWEVEKRLEEYAQSQAGRRRMMEVLAVHCATIKSMLSPVFSPERIKANREQVGRELAADVLRLTMTKGL